MTELNIFSLLVQYFFNEFIDLNHFLALPVTTQQAKPLSVMQANKATSETFLFSAQKQKMVSLLLELTVSSARQPKSAPPRASI